MFRVVFVVLWLFGSVAHCTARPPEPGFMALWQAAGGLLWPVETVMNFAERQSLESVDLIAARKARNVEAYGR